MDKFLSFEIIWIIHIFKTGGKVIRNRNMNKIIFSDLSLKRPVIAITLVSPPSGTKSMRATPMSPVFFTISIWPSKRRRAGVKDYLFILQYSPKT